MNQIQAQPKLWQRLPKARRQENTKNSTRLQLVASINNPANWANPRNARTWLINVVPYFGFKVWFEKSSGDQERQWKDPAEENGNLIHLYRFESVHGITSDDAYQILRNAEVTFEKVKWPVEFSMEMNLSMRTDLKFRELTDPLPKQTSQETVKWQKSAWLWPFCRASTESIQLLVPRETIENQRTGTSWELNTKR